MRFGICTSIDNIESLEKWGYDYLEANISKNCTDGRSTVSEAVKSRELKYKVGALISLQQCIFLILPQNGNQ